MSAAQLWGKWVWSARSLAMPTSWQKCCHSLNKRREDKPKYIGMKCAFGLRTFLLNSAPTPQCATGCSSGVGAETEQAHEFNLEVNVLGHLRKEKEKTNKQTQGEMVIYQKPALRDSLMAMAGSFEGVSFHLRIFRKPLFETAPK